MRELVTLRLASVTGAVGGTEPLFVSTPNAACPATRALIATAGVKSCFPAAATIFVSVDSLAMPPLDTSVVAGTVVADSNVETDDGMLIAPPTVPSFRLCRNCAMVTAPGAWFAVRVTPAKSCDVTIPSLGMLPTVPIVILPTLKVQLCPAR